MKRFVLSIVAAAVAMLAAAQWSVAPKAGLNWSKVNFPESYGGNPSSLTGFHAGVAVTYQINKWLDVQGELLYTMRGLDWDDLYVTDTGAFEILSLHGLQFAGRPAVGRSVEI